MTLVAQLVIAIYLGTGALALSGYAVSVVIRSQLGPNPDFVSLVLYRTGQIVIVAGALVVGGALVLAPVVLVVRALGGSS